MTKKKDSLSPSQSKVFKALRYAKAPLTKGEIAGKTKISTGPLTNVLKSLVNKGRITQNEKGDWVAITDAKPAPPPGPWETCQLQPEGNAILVLRTEDGGVNAYTGEIKKPGKFEPLPHVEVHSPTGFEYGYAGSGPADLALSICCYFVPARYAHAYYQDFKRDFIVQETGTQWGISAKGFYEWFKKEAQHEWRQRAITKGQDAGTTLPERCTNCGESKRTDGKHGPCGRGSSNQDVLPALNNRVGIETGHDTWQDFLAHDAVAHESVDGWTHHTHEANHYLVAPTGAVLVFTGVHGNHAWAQVKAGGGDGLLTDFGYTA